MQEGMAAVLRGNFFPFPGAWGLEYIGLQMGRDFLVLLLLFGWCWFLDWGSEEARERFSRRQLDFMATLVSFVVLVGGFAVAAWLWLGVICRSEYAKIQYLAQTTSNLSPLECAILLVAAFGLSKSVRLVFRCIGSARRSPPCPCGASPLPEGGFSSAQAPSGGGARPVPLMPPSGRGVAQSAGGRTRLFPALRFLLSALPLLATVWWCVAHYFDKPPRIRSVALIYAEACGILALGAAVLALTARPVWRRRTSPIRGGHWKRFVPRAFWLVFLAALLRGAYLLGEARAVERISAGAVCGPVESGRSRGTEAPPIALSAANLQSAIDAAPDGAVLDIPAGTYGPVCTRGRRITLRASDGPERTVIDASLMWAQGVTNRCATLASPRSADRHARFFDLMQYPHQLNLGWMVPAMGEGRKPEPAPPGGASRLVGFTLRGGHADLGGGAFGGTLEDCVLEGNLAEFCGAGAFGTRLVRCTVRRNYAGWMGGGVWGGSSEECSVTNNAAGDFGGGVWGGVHAGLKAAGNHARHHAETAATAAAQ